MSEYVAEQRYRASMWRQLSPTIPDEHRSPGAYRRWTDLPFCLAPEARLFNLLPEARDLALSRFAAAGIPWHDGAGDLPSNHLLSSQVQCVNALAPLITRPDSIASIFGDLLDIAEVVPFEGTGQSATSFDRADFVVFEWPGAADYLGERSGYPLARGANTTSVDAAIRYVGTDGSIQIALIEWKYTESYQGKKLRGGSESNAERRERYSRWWSADGPMVIDGWVIDEVLVEPLYQLFRLQCLAQEMTRAREGNADRVVVVYAAPRGNADLLDFYPDQNGGPRLTGHDVLLSNWRDHLIEEESFRYFNTESLLEPGSAVSDSYRSRYGGVEQASL